MSTDMRQELNELKAVTRKLVGAVTTMSGRLDRVEGRLDDVGSAMAGVMKALDNFTAEILASRSDRLLFNRSFSEQRETLHDHELRLTRLERERRPS